MDVFGEVLRGARQFLSSLPYPMYITNPDGKVLWGNQAYREGIHEWGEGPDGDRVPILSENNEVIAYTVCLKREAKLERDERDEWYQIIAQNTTDTIVLVDKDAVVRFVSPSFTMMTGYSLDQYENLDAFDIIHPVDRERVRKLHGIAFTSKESVDLEYRVQHRDGHLLYAESRVKPVLDDFGNVKYVVAVARNITERKKSEQLLENILDNVKAAVWSTDKNFTRFSLCSESIMKIAGIPRSEIMEQPNRLHDHIHADDMGRMVEIKRSLLLGQSVNESLRWSHVEGETRWGQLIVHPLRDYNGEIERLDGILMDITEKKRSELALEESEQRYKSLFDNNLDGVFSIDLDGFHIVNANPVFESMTGINKSRMTNRCFLGVIFDDDHEAVHEALYDVMRLWRSTDIECRLVRSMGKEAIVSITFVPIFLRNELNGIHGIAKDITKRKEEERDLIKSEQRYKFLQQSLNRFSADLSNVMKVSQLEQRLIEEVHSVLGVIEATVEEVPAGNGNGRECTGEMWTLLGEKGNNPVYLRIAPEPTLQKIEKEWLETAVRYVSILYDNLHFIEDLMQRLEHSVSTNETPRWMLRLLFQLSEKERSVLSSDLHDSVLQALIVWYRKLESLRSLRNFDADIQHELKQIEEGLLDAIHQIRNTCNELRPPFLLKMGLVESLKSLFEYTRMFANYEIEFSAVNLRSNLNEEQVLGLYRIIQELLNNANKHSQADKVTMVLNEHDGILEFQYSDNGIGMCLHQAGQSFQHMGIAGMEKRVISLEGKIEMRSSPQEGFHLHIGLPIPKPN
ncbi:PAS domain S-box protein [Paenibacillus sp. TRM 82003]|nr:PAS domain S-box protein [Paenibacillus sp. TRM 82003]